MAPDTVLAMVARVLVIDRGEQLKRAFDVLSDECWFDPDDINHDSAGRKLVVKFFRPQLDERQLVGRGGLRRRWRVPVYEVLLYVHEIRHYGAEDAGLGIYDFGDLSYDPARQLVTLLADDSRAFQLRAEVDRLKLEVVETGTLAGETTRKSFF